MEHLMRAVLQTVALIIAVLFIGRGIAPSIAQQPPPPPQQPQQQQQQPTSQQYSSNEILDTGHRFFGTVARSLAQIVERAGSQWGRPNGDILGQQAGGAL